ncbi:hypothetical protein CLPUN_46470 [Clostridium puniceum]|uniref:Uncharacterized protein n=1 Tax=Clostridium puniceum TaxID=29367 RepID=A0A1S8T4Z3_9CLOT|nr:hypothetical protein [Clostridium puniceum]OOM72732.1 hypothetical protein CLPUN_46470 [Clostridium puniceum]
MNKLFIKTFAKKIIQILIYGQEYKAPEYAYIPVNQTPKKNIYDNKFQR